MSALTSFVQITKSNSNLQEIEKYIKNSLQTNNDSITSPRLPQSKSYLKIVGIPYFVDKLNMHISSKTITFSKISSLCQDQESLKSHPSWT